MQDMLNNAICFPLTAYVFFFVALDFYPFNSEKPQLPPL